MPGGGVSISESHSETTCLLRDTDSEEQSHGSDSKQSASANKPHTRAVNRKDSPSIFSIASNSGSKGKAGQTGKASPGKSPGGKLASNDGSKKQLATPLLHSEVSDSWENTEVDGAPFLQDQNKLTVTSANAQPKVASKPVFKGTSSSGAAPSGNNTSPSRPSTTAQKNMAGRVLPSKTANSDVGGESSVVESSSEEDSDPLPPSDTGKAQFPKRGNANAPGSGRSKDVPLEDLAIIQKLRKTSSQRGFVAVELVEAEEARRKKEAAAKPGARADRSTLKHGLSHVKELTRLMTGEDTEENAEAVYKKVAEICTDPKMDDRLKLSCLMGKWGQPCRTLKQDVNEYFDAWVMQLYFEKKHAQKLVKKADKEVKIFLDEEREEARLKKEQENAKKAKEAEKANGGKEAEKEKEDVNKNDEGNEAKGKVSDEEPKGPLSMTVESLKKYELFRQFENSLSWWERWKLNHHYNPTGLKKKDGLYYCRKNQLKRAQLLRKMQKRLSTEERAFIREETRVYHDILANSGLPLLHIAIKNESVNIVRAYLLAVMAFAPFGIKREAIEATQHQKLQAFYYAMTHSTTTMIKMFMETILNSDFLFLKDKEKILHARRPDKLFRGTYGISAFWMAMGMGDMARADVFMSTLLAWDPNCKVEEYSEIKTRLLRAQKSFYYSDSAKHEAYERGHKKLIRRYDRYLNSSHLHYSQKDYLFYMDRDPIPKLLVQPRPTKWTEEDEALKKAVWEMMEMKDQDALEESFEISPGVKRYIDNKRERRIRFERQAELLKEAGEEVPPDLRKDPYKDLAMPPVKNLKHAGDYAQLSTFPEPKLYEERRTDGDDCIGVPPPPSKEAIKNSWKARADSGTLPVRSSSYGSGLAKLPKSPSLLDIGPGIEKISPKKRTPNSVRRTGEQAGLSNGTPTRLVSDRTPKSVQSGSSNSPGRRKDLRKRQLSTSKAELDTPIPT